MIRFLTGAALLLLVGASALAAETSDGNADPVVATVNGDPIHKSDVLAAQQLLPPQYRSLPFDMIFKPLVERLIDVKLAAAAGRRANLNEDPGFRKELARISDRLLERAYIDRTVAERVTEEALRQRHEKAVRDFTPEAEIRARHILVASREEAEKVIKELENGADFAELARTRSVGPSGKRGGDLGYFVRGRMVKEFADAAFALTKGEFTHEPVKTQFGWHVIKVEDRRQTKAPSFEQEKDELRAKMREEVVAELRDRLKKKATIERFAPDGSPLQGDEGTKDE